MRVENFWRNVTRGSGCWTWERYRDHDGYGRCNIGDRRGVLAHRVAYELAFGPLPPGVEVDHLCGNRGCVNPTHLEAVSKRENNVRRFGLTMADLPGDTCIHGHAFDDTNTYVQGGRRTCRTCNRLAVARYAARKKGRVTA